MIQLLLLILIYAKSIKNMVIPFENWNWDRIWSVLFTKKIGKNPRIFGLFEISKSTLKKMVFNAQNDLVAEAAAYVDRCWDSVLVTSRDKRNVLWLANFVQAKIATNIKSNSNWDNFTPIEQNYKFSIRQIKIFATSFAS